MASVNADLLVSIFLFPIERRLIIMLRVITTFFVVGIFIFGLVIECQI